MLTIPPQRIRSVLLFFSAVLMGLTNAHAASCSVSTTGINFSQNYDPSSAVPDDSSTDIQVNCDNVVTAVNYTLSLNAGNAGNFTRQMQNSNHSKLSYNIFTDPARTIVFGDGTNGTVTIAGICNTVPNCSSISTVYGRIPGNQTSLTVGTYTDSLTLSINY